MQAVVDIILHANPLIIYLIVAVILLLESSGIPITNNTLLLLTGALTALGNLNLWVLIAAAILGSIAGACLAYVLGKWKGHRLLVRLASFFRIDSHKVDMTEQWFHRAGLWMIFFSRMTPYIRPFGCFPAGISRMPFPRFFVAALSGSIIWCIVLIHIGAMLGPHWQIALLCMRNYTLPVLAGLLVLGIGYFFAQRSIRRYLHKRLSSRTEAAEDTVVAHNSRDLLEV